MGVESITKVDAITDWSLGTAAAFGGTNFALVELARSSPLKYDLYRPFACVGHTAGEMLDHINQIVRSDKPYQCKQIISQEDPYHSLTGTNYISKSHAPVCFRAGIEFLRFARGDYDDLRIFVSDQIKGLKFAQAFLKPKTGTWKIRLSEDFPTWLKTQETQLHCSPVQRSVKQEKKSWERLSGWRSNWCRETLPWTHGKIPSAVSIPLRNSFQTSVVAGKIYHVPMAIEESSVVAAASHSARFWARSMVDL